jgi:hypothetical protein
LAWNVSVTEGDPTFVSVTEGDPTFVSVTG